MKKLTKKDLIEILKSAPDDAEILLPSNDPERYANLTKVEIFKTSILLEGIVL